nr:hypothetical protein [Tanacetum cinerariifolium]
MSIFKVPTSVLFAMESIQKNFFYGSQGAKKKITWIKWTKVLAAKHTGGLEVSSFFALIRALLFKWVWRFISQDNSLWYRFISAVHGSRLHSRSSHWSSTWCNILREVNVLKSKGIDLVSHCKKRVGNGVLTQFWMDIWVGDTQKFYLYPRLFALELSKDICVADKLHLPMYSSFRHPVRGGAESSQLVHLLEKVSSVTLSNSCDRWFWDLNGNGVFCVKDVRCLFDDFFLPKSDVATRWVKQIPIKINFFAWRVFLDRLPSKLNLSCRGIMVNSLLCPTCNSSDEDVSHSLFSCPLAVYISLLVCHWWDVVWMPYSSYSEWLSLFKSIRMGFKIK